MKCAFTLGANLKAARDEAAFIKFTFSHETADLISWDNQLEVLAFKIYGPMGIRLDIIVVYRLPSQKFKLNGILIERLQ